MRTETILARAEAQHRAGRLAAAEALYRQVLAREPDNAEALRRCAELQAALAAQLARQRDYPGAAAAFEAALQLGGERADWRQGLGGCHAAVGRVEAAAVQYRQALALEPDRRDSLRGLGLALLSLGQSAEAIVPLARLAALDPDNQAALRDLGRAQYCVQRWDDALASFARAQALGPGDAETSCLVGSILHAQGRHADAEAAYREALRLGPELPGALFGLGFLLLRELGRPADAIPLFERLAAAAPDHGEVNAELGNAYRSLAQLDPAIAAYRRHLARHPDSAFAHVLLGQALSEAGQKDEALAFLERALALRPERALEHLVHVDVGNVMQDLGRTDAAQDAFRRALALAPLLTRKSAASAPDFSVLLVLMPGANNTPYDYLIDRTRFDAHVLLLLPDYDYDIGSLAAHADVVMNLVSDADQGGDMLPHAARLIDRIGKPAVNHPDKIRPTGRESIARALAGIPGCRVARVRRHAGAALARPEFIAGPAAPAPPFLARLVGRHCGDEFELIEDASALERLVARNAGADFYLLDYLDYRSPDGFFRKYRFFFVGEEILPYHLAIGGGWKVHHFSTDMANQPVLQREEEAFLRAPQDVFEPRHFEVLRAIRGAIGLDFFGIDCSLDAAGNLLVFEANASMLVHDSNHAFPYKSPAARRIKAAFAGLLAARANS